MSAPVVSKSFFNDIGYLMKSLTYHSVDIKKRKDLKKFMEL